MYMYIIMARNFKQLVYREDWRYMAKKLLALNKKQSRKDLLCRVVKPSGY